MAVNDELSHWIRKISYYRNVIHSFNYRNIGTAEEFGKYISKLDIYIY